jgi:hypothetical protein
MILANVKIDCDVIFVFSPIMSQLDSELNLLRARLASLEEHKRIQSETAAEKKAFPLKTLEGIVDMHRNVRQGGTNKFQNERYIHSREKLSFLEPILDVLKNMEGRLELLEKRPPLVSSSRKKRRWRLGRYNPLVNIGQILEKK